MSTLFLEVGARLHFSLIDLGYATRRVFGGCGLAVDNPRSVICWQSADNTELTVTDKAGIDIRTKNTVESAIGRLQSESRPIHGTLTILATPPQHIGLGVTTSLVLSALQVLNEAEGLGFSQRRLKRLSGRGGTSGIGLTAFFEGGFILDAGQRRGSNGGFQPSGSREATSQSLHVARLAFPTNWSIRLLLPEGNRWSGKAESEFFRAHTPIPDQEVLEVLGITYHCIVPSIVDEDLPELKIGLETLNRTGFKAREVASHGPGVRDLLDRLGRLTPAPAGMSSMGPLVYVIGPNALVKSAAVEDAIGDGVTDLGLVNARALGPTAVRNPAEWEQL